MHASHTAPYGTLACDWVCLARLSKLHVHVHSWDMTSPLMGGGLADDAIIPSPHAQGDGNLSVCVLCGQVLKAPLCLDY